MTKCVPKVEQGAIPLLCLIAHDDFGLHLARSFDRVISGRQIPGGHGRGVGFKPGEKISIPKQPVFHHLTIARQKIPWRQGGKQPGVAQNERRLMKRTNKVLAVAGVDSGFATHRTVHLRQQGCGDLNKPHAPAQHCRSKADQITDDATAKGHDNIAPFNLLIQQPFNRAGEMRPAFRAFAGWQRQRIHRDTLFGQPGPERVQMHPRHRFIADHANPWAVQQGRDPTSRIRDQARADLNVITALA